MIAWYRVCPHCRNGTGNVIKKIGAVRWLRCQKCARRFKRAFRIRDLRKTSPPKPK